jgi:hypothetical protein
MKTKPVSLLSLKLSIATLALIFVQQSPSGAFGQITGTGYWTEANYMPGTPVPEFVPNTGFPTKETFSAWATLGPDARPFSPNWSYGFPNAAFRDGASSSVSVFPINRAPSSAIGPKRETTGGASGEPK